MGLWRGKDCEWHKIAGSTVVVYPGRVHLALPPLTQRLEIEGAELEDHSAELAGLDKVIGLPDGGCLDGC